MFKSIPFLIAFFLLCSNSPLRAKAIDTTLHVVKKGENAFRISLQYNKRLTTFLEQNELNQNSILNEGDTVLIISSSITERSVQNTNQSNDSTRILAISEPKLTFSGPKPNAIIEPNNPAHLPKEIGFFHTDKVTNGVIWTNLILLGFTALMILVLVLSRIIKNSIKRRKDRLFDYFENVITGNLFGETQTEASEPSNLLRFQNQQIARTPYQRSILSKLLIKIHQDLTGESEQVVRNMFVLHKLDKDVEHRLKSKKWFIRAKAVQDVGRMKLTSLQKQVEERTKDTNEEVRFEALLALVQLEPNNPLSFLDSYKGTLDTWRQVQLFYALDKIPPEKITLQNAQFYHTEPTVIQFSIRLAIRYNQSAISPDLFNLLNHPSKRVRLAVIQAFGELSISESIQALKLQFEQVSEPEKLAIIQTLGLLEYEVDAVFFEKLIHQDSFYIKLAAAKSLTSIPDAEVLLQKGLHSTDSDWARICKHALDSRI